jgi:hypothetical protein
VDSKISLATKRTCINMINKLLQLSSGSSGYDIDLFPFLVHRFDFLYAYMLPRGVLPVYWTCRVFRGSAGLAECSEGPEISRGARKLARTSGL